MLQADWSAFEVRLQARAPDLHAELRALLAQSFPASTVAGSSTDPTLLRPPSAEPTQRVADEGPSALVGSLPAAAAHQVLGELGRGGMGVVERVWDPRLRRVVARKVMHATLSAGARARVLEEARATAQLQHPGIVPVYDLGEADGRPWFTMKEVQGETLRTVLRREHQAARRSAEGRSAGLRRLMAIYLAVCRAVGFAHARGVVHRDLKPTNVMVGGHGEVLVMDWGIAKVLAGGDEEWVPDGRDPTGRASAEQTRVGSVLGTPAFMSPEQARGEVASVDQRSDVYALGAVLYELLTGAAPYRGDSAEVVRAVVVGPPPSLRGLAGERALSTFGAEAGELVEVCERAMSRAREDRPADASVLADAVQAWLDGSRLREQAMAVVADAAARTPQVAALRARAVLLRTEAEAELKGVGTWQPEADKVAAWAKEDEATALEQQAALVDLEAESLLRASLTHAPALPEAHAALAERYQREHAAAEVARTSPARAEALLRQHLVALPDGHPVRRAGAAYLQGDGALTLITDPPGAEVELHRYELRSRRLVAVPERALGRTPLRAVPLARGSWLCVVRHPERAPVRYPVFLRRGEHWDGVPPEGGDPHPVVLPRPSELGPDDRYVPAGWAWTGGDREALNSLPRRRLWVDGHVVRRFPVTNREYLVFLDALVAAGRADEALRFAPRERAGTVTDEGALVYGFDGRCFSLRPDADGDVWAPDWPVILVEWFGAEAFAAWEAQRTGQPWSLPSEIAWEKSARGVDGRIFPWGDWADTSWACINPSYRGRAVPAVVDSYPVDESVYGVRGLGGNVRDWCAEDWRAEGPPVEGSRILHPPAGAARGPARVFRGGGWNFTTTHSRSSFRDRAASVTRSSLLGFRLARVFP
jgi:formylglycine-generating enzyme required for sulfatase activity